MTARTADDVADAALKTQPQLRHAWGTDDIRRLDGSVTHDGNARTEKTCERCGLIKITVHAAQGLDVWNEWRHPNGDSFTASHTPPCRVVREVPAL